MKLDALARGEHAILSVTASVGALESSLGATLPNARNLVKGLHSAGAAYSPDQLADWVTPEIWRWAVSNCHLMRNRVTVIDLLDAVGWWTATDVDSVLARVDVLIAEVQSV